MTTEAAATKLAYLFGRYPGDMDAVRELVGVSLRGEISHPDAYLRPFFEAPRYKSSGSIESDPTKRPPAPPPAPTAPAPRETPPPRDAMQRRRDIALGAAIGVGLALVLARGRRWRYVAWLPAAPCSRTRPPARQRIIDRRTDLPSSGGWATRTGSAVGGAPAGGSAGNTLDLRQMSRAAPFFSLYLLDLLDGLGLERRRRFTRAVVSVGCRATWQATPLCPRGPNITNQSPADHPGGPALQETC